MNVFLLRNMRFGSTYFIPLSYIILIQTYRQTNTFKVCFCEVRPKHEHSSVNFVVDAEMCSFICYLVFHFIRLLFILLSVFSSRIYPNSHIFNL